MNIAIFGGTFDPVHRGHLAVARAAAQRFQIGRTYFVPADIPPHKQKQPVTPYYHRYAMLALALAGEKNFVPSLLEAPELIQAEGKLASYSIDTVRRFKERVRKVARLFFIIGIDAFMDVAKWRSPVELLQECEFIVVSRPGYSLADVANALPEELRPADNVTKLFSKQVARGEIVLAGTTIHLMDGVEEPVSATKIRAAAAAGRNITPQVGAQVADYIRKLQLYKPAAEPGSPELPTPKNSGRGGQLRIVGGRAHSKRS